MIQAGQFRHPVRIQQPVSTQDELGQMEPSFEDMFPDDPDIRAEIAPLSGREFVAARQVHADVTTRITLRRYPGVEASCRIVRTIEDDSPPTVEYYDILAVLPDNVSGRRYMTLMCVQRFSDGWRRGED